MREVVHHSVSSLLFIDDMTFPEGEKKKKKKGVKKYSKISDDLRRLYYDEPQNPFMGEVGKTPGDHLVQLPCSKQDRPPHVAQGSVEF